jgi:hypothetical protein
MLGQQQRYNMIGQRHDRFSLVLIILGSTVPGDYGPIDISDR